MKNNMKDKNKMKNACLNEAKKYDWSKIIEKTNKANTKDKKIQKKQ